MWTFVYYLDCNLRSGNYGLSLICVCMMSSPKGMDNLFWGKEFEDVVDWIKWLEMALEV